MSALEKTLVLVENLARLLPAGGISSTITTVASLIKLGTEEVRDVAPYVKNIITALRSNDNITATQMTKLSQLEAQADAEFDAAAKDAGL